jgi:hypothetical protein
MGITYKSSMPFMKLTRVIWKVIPQTKGFVQLSSHGAIRKVKPGYNHLVVNFQHTDIYESIIPKLHRISIGHHEEIELPYFKIRIDSKTVLKPLASLVYEIFHGISDVEIKNILYKDGNEHNCSLENLILCRKEDFQHFFMLKYQSPSQSSSFLHSNELQFVDSLSSMVTMYNADGYFTGLFKSIHEVSKRTGLNSNQISNDLLGVKLRLLDQGIIKFGRGPLLIDLSKIHTGEHLIFKSKSVFNYYLIRKYNMLGKLLRVFNNLYEVVRNEKYDVDEFYQELKSKRIFQYKGAIWCMETPNKKQNLG